MRNLPTYERFLSESSGDQPDFENALQREFWEVLSVWWSMESMPSSSAANARWKKFTGALAAFNSKHGTKLRVPTRQEIGALEAFDAPLGYVKTAKDLERVWDEELQPADKYKGYWARRDESVNADSLGVLGRSETGEPIRGMRNLPTYEDHRLLESADEFCSILEADDDWKTARRKVAQKIRQAEGLIDDMKGKRGEQFTARRRKIEAALEQLRKKKGELGPSNNAPGEKHDAGPVHRKVQDLADKLNDEHGSRISFKKGKDGSFTLMNSTLGADERSDTGSQIKSALRKGLSDLGYEVEDANDGRNLVFREKK